MGQHFLADARFRRRIVEALHLTPEVLVIEIGAGRGAMTSLLAERARRLVAIELDTSLAEHLRERHGAERSLEILTADILSTDIGEICRRHEAEKCVVFGNLPYYITSPIIHHLFAFRDWLRGMTLLVQREVAERLVAEPGTRAYGHLSVLAQLHSQPRLLFSVPPGAFSPPPKVYSALVSFRIKPRFPAWSPEDNSKFLDFVKRCFAQKRKNLLNNLSQVWPRLQVEGELVALGLSQRLRAEQLTLEQFADLYKRLRGSGPRGTRGGGESPS
jgi:16S rRNA (adenine1518-N6/adenine1519-N6)-dimethyltransferase